MKARANRDAASGQSRPTKQCRAHCFGAPWLWLRSPGGRATNTPALGLSVGRARAERQVVSQSQSNRNRAWQASASPHDRQAIDGRWRKPRLETFGGSVVRCTGHMLSSQELHTCTPYGRHWTVQDNPQVKWHVVSRTLTHSLTHSYSLSLSLSLPPLLPRRRLAAADTSS